MCTNYEIINVGWSEIKKLSKTILEQISEKKLNIDTLVTVFRGGSVLSLILAANIENLETSCVHLRRSLSNSANAKFGDSIYKGITNIDALKNKNVLITEDIIDSGLTLDKVIEELHKWNVKKIYVATFYNFNKEKYKDAICGKKMDKHCWMVFPWEEKINETN